MFQSCSKGLNFSLTFIKKLILTDIYQHLRFVGHAKLPNDLPIKKKIVGDEDRKIQHKLFYCQLLVHQVTFFRNKTD